jgi:simple sugar transport system substrate-binding protein
MRRSAILAGLFALSICSTPLYTEPAWPDETPLYITVVKSTGFNWFKRMETGVKEFGKKNGINAVQVGPSKPDSAMQLQSLEDAIAQKPKVIAVVPLEVAALEPALAKAKERGIIVITHEAADAKNAV